MSSAFSRFAYLINAAPHLWKVASEVYSPSYGFLYKVNTAPRRYVYAVEIPESLTNWQAVKYAEQTYYSYLMGAR